MRTFGVGEPLREYGFAWPELFREFFLLGLFVSLILIGYHASDSPEVIQTAASNVVLVWLVLFFATGIYFSRKPKIVIYENGVGLKTRDDEQTWTFSQITRWDGQRTTQRVNGIPVFKTGANHFYVGDEKIFSVGSHRACADHLAGLLIMKMAQANGVPRDYAAFQEGKTIQYNGVKINKNGLGGNKQSVSWDEIDKLDFKNDNLRVKRLTDKRLRKFGYVSPVASYYLMGLLDRVRGTDLVERKTAELSRSRGQIWAAQGGRLALATLIIVPILAGVVFLLANSNDKGFRTYDGLRQINAQYGSDIGIACYQDGTYPYGDNPITKPKFLIVDSSDNNDPHIFEELQSALPLKQQAASGTDLTTVVCVRAYTQLLDQCTYGDVTRRRYLHDYAVTLIDVASRTVIASDFVDGTDPQSCPKNDPGYDLHGSPPTSAAFTTWLRFASKPTGNSL